MFIKPVGDHFEIWIREDRNLDGTAPPDRACLRRGKPHHFAEHGDAVEYLEGQREFFEEDHDDYLEENRFEIAQMERLEAFRNER